MNLYIEIGPLWLNDLNPNINQQWAESMAKVISSEGHRNYFEYDRQVDTSGN